MASTFSTGMVSFMTRRWMPSSLLTWLWWLARMVLQSSILPLLVFLPLPELRVSTSKSFTSTASCSFSTNSATHLQQSTLACSSGVSFSCRASPSLEYVLVLVSFSQILNCSILVSMSFRYSTRASLSLTSELPIQLLIWSRSRCSFLISFLRSPSYFSFWFCCSALYTFSHISSNNVTPSSTFFNTRSISVCSFRAFDILTGC
mmetsp:Transcript_29453/g.69082  ORF Transcript_29453/g.69082 Transcript_29453/m.69082 type:complete len:204 (+) Transcript_29453:1538-2149(+)